MCALLGAVFAVEVGKAGTSGDWFVDLMALINQNCTFHKSPPPLFGCFITAKMDEKWSKLAGVIFHGKLMSNMIC